MWLDDNFLMKKSAIIAFAITILLGQTHSAFADLQKNSTSQKALQLCLSPTELECIETFEVIYKNGKFRKMTLVEGPRGNFSDELGQIIENSGSRWSYINSKGEVRNIVITATLNGENYQSPYYKKLYPAMWFSFLGLNKDELNTGLKFKVVIRSSWLKPQGVGLMASSASFLEEKTNYGFRYTFSGSPFLSTSLNSPEKYHQLNTSIQDDTKSDGEFPNLYFVIDHRSSIAGGSFWGDICSDYGYSVTSHNAIGAGQPYMSDNETLRFNIGAPHLLSTGEVTEGFFTTDIPVAYIDCRWPQNTLTKSPKIEVVVTNSDGTNQVATTAITLEKGVLKVRAFGFHYSQPTIVVRATNKAETPVLNDSNNIAVKSPPVIVNSKKITITCIMGKKIKKVTAVKPLCPIGYKKR